MANGSINLQCVVIDGAGYGLKAQCDGWPPTSTHQDLQSPRTGISIKASLLFCQRAAMNSSANAGQWTSRIPPPPTTAIAGQPSRRQTNSQRAVEKARIPKEILNKRASVMRLLHLGTLVDMNPQARSILDQLQVVVQQRQIRAQDPSLDARVLALKTYQHQRFQRTYADLLCDSNYAKAARFFLDELYGPGDFIRRDTQFARVVPALVRLFPTEIVTTVKALADLHALSEQLDTATALALHEPVVDEARYATAWCAVGRESDRRQQIMLTCRVGMALDAYTRSPLLRHTLKLMRRPAQVAGLVELQTFLELGFDTFREMGDARPFLDIIATRENTIARELFAPLHQAPHGSSPEFGSLKPTGVLGTLEKHILQDGGTQ